MSVQLPLLQDANIKKSIVTVDIHALDISEFNPRSSRDEEDVKRLADRIARNGFEITRALWAYQNGDGYKVFAGGTRLEAARRAGIRKVPIVLHEGLTEDDIVRLADEDNENDEYHARVSPVDVWENYAWLSEQRWTQERIAKAKGVKQAIVSKRIGLHKLPEAIKTFIHQDKLGEAHLIEMSALFIDEYFSAWLTTDQARLEIVQEAAKRKMTTKDTRKLAQKWRDMIALAKTHYEDLSKEYRDLFLDELQANNARTQAAVQQAYNYAVEKHLADVAQAQAELAKKQSEAEAERLRLEQEKAKQEAIQGVLKDFICGDFFEVMQSMPAASIDIIITDPPYPEQYIPLYEKLSEAAARVLKPGGSLLAMSGQSYLNQLYPLLDKHLTYHWTISYQTPGGQSPQIWPRKINTFWKPVLWYVNGEYQGDWHGDVIKSDVNDNDKRFHGWGQSESGMARLVESFSEPGQVVLDPFLGGGTTGLIALRLGRKFIGIDLDKSCVETSKDRVFGWLSGEKYG